MTSSSFGVRCLPEPAGAQFVGFVLEDERAGRRELL